MRLAFPGSNRHTRPGNIPHVLSNPADDKCYRLGQADGETENATDRVARLYYGSSCTVTSSRRSSPTRRTTASSSHR